MLIFDWARVLWGRIEAKKDFEAEGSSPPFAATCFSFFIDVEGWNGAKKGCHGDLLRWWSSVYRVVVSDLQAGFVCLAVCG